LYALAGRGSHFSSSGCASLRNGVVTRYLDLISGRKSDGAWRDACLSHHHWRCYSALRMAWAAREQRLVNGGMVASYGALACRRAWRRAGGELPCCDNMFLVVASISPTSLLHLLHISTTLAPPSPTTCCLPCAALSRPLLLYTTLAPLQHSPCHMLTVLNHYCSLNW
jgi:hypothetical protein